MKTLQKTWNGGCFGKIVIVVLFFLLFSCCLGAAATVLLPESDSAAPASESEPVEVEATDTPKPVDTVAPADTPPPTDTPALTKTPKPTRTPVPTLPPAVANKQANLRDGPGTEFSVVGSVEQGEKVILVGVSTDGEWFETLYGPWIAAFLVDNADTDLPVTKPQPTATPDARTPLERCIYSGAGVRYVVTGKNVRGVSVTLQNDTGGTDQGDYQLPICKNYSGFSYGDFMYISAQIISPTEGAGTIKCQIWNGEELVAEANASGFASIATCDGSMR